jgi:hypothetical protein
MFRYLLFFISFPFLCFGVNFTFSQGSAGWNGGFSDYPVGEEEFYELAWGWESLPQSTISSEGVLLDKGLFLSGNNHSDDLFMFVKKKVTGLNPSASYTLDFQVLIESNVPSHCIGIGGAPGESVFFKAGASAIEPKKTVIQSYYVLNVDKGNQSLEGENARVIGTLANPAVDPQNPSYQPMFLYSSNSLIVQSSAQGELWIFLGTDSGFEGITKYFIAEVNLTIRPL